MHDILLFEGLYFAKSIHNMPGKEKEKVWNDFLSVFKQKEKKKGFGTLKKAFQIGSEIHLLAVRLIPINHMAHISCSYVTEDS